MCDAVSYCVTDQSEIRFKNNTQMFNVSDRSYNIPVVRTRGLENTSSVNWRTRKSSRLDETGQLKFAPGEAEKNIVIDPHSRQSPIMPETFELELFEPSPNSSVKDGKTTQVNIDNRGESPSAFTCSLMLGYEDIILFQLKGTQQMYRTYTSACRYSHLKIFYRCSFMVSVCGKCFYSTI